MVTKIFCPRSLSQIEIRSFEADAAIAMGKLVEINSDKEIAATSTEAKAIGIINDMPKYRAEEETGTIAGGDIAEVLLFGRTFVGVSGGTFSAGAYVKPSSGAIITSGATASNMIALEASTAAGQMIEFLVR